MPDLGQMQRELSEFRSAGDTAAAEARAAVLHAEPLRARLQRLQRSGGGDAIEALKRQIAALEAEAATKRAAAADLRGRLEAGLGVLVAAQPDDLLAQAGDDLPFLLFPVRLETKFAAGQNGSTLRVRIFPDDILISTHDPLLSQAERDAGEAYWLQRTAAVALDPEPRRAAELGAWTQVAARFGGPRARFVARRTRPVAWPPAVGADAGPSAASDEPVRAPGGGLPPRARLLPDQFIVIAFDAQDRIAVQGAGAKVPDTLKLGPDPEAAAAELSRGADGRLAADPDLAWLVDYDKALEVGMAVTLPVAEAYMHTGFSRVVALGVRLSEGAVGSSAAAEGLFAEHRFTRGIDLLRAGAPTNNTDGAPSAFTTDLSADEALVAQEVDGVAPTGVLDHAAKSDAQRLAEALGVNFEAVSDWPSAAEAFDVAEALAMNRALWPATFGAFLRDMIGQRMSADFMREIETFFLTYVTGRSLAPNLRVGAQPYGVLATSDLRSWSEPEDGLPKVLQGLTWFRERFEALDLDPAAPIAQMGRGEDTLAMSMRVMGQLASSVDFLSRKAVTDEASWNTLQYNGVIPLLRIRWWDRLQAERNAAFAELGVDRTGLPLGELTFFRAADPLGGPLIDRDPAFPLSESAAIAPFDGARNYIEWLLTAPEAELRAQVFKDANSVAIPAPTALLFRLLHNAWMTQLTDSAGGVLRRLRPELLATAVSASVVNVGNRKVVTDDQATLFDTAKLEITRLPRGLGDHLLDLSVAGQNIDTTPEALPLQSQRAALERLKDRPTAALERLLAEHLDLGAYRLDAWQTGLISRRLDRIRRRDGGARGLLIGAYGYVEDLKPRPAPKPVPAESLPEALRSSAPVTEREGGGGFVHAPSLGHAVTAAVLRNGYLTHAEPQNREVMSVNLTSRRVRSAMTFIEGVRAGQELAALLGYQFERGLHERHPGVELDQTIYVLRARFPLVSNRLTPTPDGTPAEVVEARNVIDGHDLLQHVRGKTYPYGLDGLPADTARRDAIVAEIEHLEESLDAVADLLLAEGVHQAVQSNTARTRGLLAAVSDGEAPPVPDVAQGLRSGRTLTQRVALHLPPAGGGWAGGVSPGAQANPRLNSWLAAQFPPPARIGFEARLSGAGPETVTLDQTGLEPIDLVLMSADRFGDGSSALEQFLADQWRGANGVADAVPTLYGEPPPDPAGAVLVIDAKAATGATPLAVFAAQLRALRRLVTGARGLDASDYRLVGDQDQARANPRGYRLATNGDLNGLPGQLDTARAGLAADLANLAVLLAPLKPLYEAARADAATFDPSAWTAGLAGVRAALRRMWLRGVGEASVRSSAGVDLNAALGVYEQGQIVAAAVDKKLARAVDALTPPASQPPASDPAEAARQAAARLDLRATKLGDAARELLGPGFPVQPVFELSTDARSEVEAGLAQPIEDDPLALEAWLQSLARVRPRMGDVALASAAAQWRAGGEPKLSPVQLPRRATDPWIGKAWTTPPADGEILSVMTLDVPAALSGDLQGLMLDEFTEVVPAERETTGITFQFDRPTAAAPQALLLAVPPNPDGRWRWDALVGVVVDTFARARLRAVEPDQIAASPLFPVLPTTMLGFTSLASPVSTFLLDDALSVAKI